MIAVSVVAAVSIAAVIAIAAVVVVALKVLGYVLNEGCSRVHYLS